MIKDKIISNLTIKKGFTLVELLVTVSIAITLFSVIAFNQRAHNDKNGLTNQADRISLMLSQAQVFSTGARELSPGSNNFDAPYGLSFSMINSGEGKAYIYFADTIGNNYKYNGTWACSSSDSECLEKINIPEGNYVESVCILNVSTSDCATAKRVDISFDRPSVAAKLIFYKQDGQELILPSAIGARIMLRSPLDNSRSVTVYNTGQISVQ